MAFTVQCSPATTHCFSSKYYQVLTATHLPTTEGWKADLAALCNKIHVQTNTESVQCINTKHNKVRITQVNDQLT